MVNSTEQRAAARSSKQKRGAEAEAEAHEKANAALPERLVAKPLAPHEDYKTLGADWSQNGNRAHYEQMIDEVTGPEPDKFRAYRFT